MSDVSHLREKIAHAKIRLRSTVGERWLARNFELIEAVAHAGRGLVDLWEASPVRLDSDEPKTDQIIELLFPGNPLLCCAWSRHRFDTRARENWYSAKPTPTTMKKIPKQGKMNSMAPGAPMPLALDVRVKAKTVHRNERGIGPRQAGHRRRRRGGGRARVYIQDNFRGVVGQAETQSR